MEIFPLSMFPTWIVPIPAVGPLKPVGAEDEQIMSTYCQLQVELTSITLSTSQTCLTDSKSASYYTKADYSANRLLTSSSPHLQRTLFCC